jgi:hypothetical protein
VASGNWSFPCSPRNPAKVREELRLLRSLIPGWRARQLAWSPRSGVQLEFGRYLRLSGELPPGPSSTSPNVDVAGGHDLRFRRQTAHVSEDNLRWTARARFGTYRFFGFVLTDSDGYADLTPAGERFVDSLRPGDVLLRQLLKWQYPDFQHRGGRWPASDFSIFPFVATSRLILELDGLTRDEIALFCFTMRRTEDAAATAAQVSLYRERRPRSAGRVGRARSVRETQIFAQSRYAAEGFKVAQSTNDYADALVRYFRFTGLFSVRGARLVVAAGREAEVGELVYTSAAPPPSPSPSLQLALGEAPPLRLSEPRPLFSDYQDHAAFHSYYGDAGQPKFPWEDPHRFAALARALDAQVASLRTREAHLRSGRTVLSGPTLAPDLNQAEMELRVEALRAERQRLERSIFSFETHSPARLREALDFYGPIVRKEVIDPPTYLEWNTWRVFLALDAAREVVPNLQLDDDLQPLNPAQGNQPDLTVDYGDFLLVVEATLRGGADQRQAEARPVTRHVLEAQRRYQDPLGGGVSRPVYGLFLAPRIHPDTANDFFVALKYRVIERQQIVAIPLTLRQFAAAVRPFSGHIEFAPGHLRRLLSACVDAGLSAETGDEWIDGIAAALRLWLAGLGVPLSAEEPLARPLPLPLF